MIPALKSISLVFAGGGTGGHFFPAVAIADRVCELVGEACETKIVFVGTTRGIEHRLRDSLGYPLHLINIRGLVRSFTLKNLAVPFLIVGALWQSRALLKNCSPDLVVGTGGYVSWPVLRMAAWMKIPGVLQEQNSYPGVTTRQLAGRVSRVYLGFDEARRFLPDRVRFVTTGNPVRRSVVGGDRREALGHFKLDPSRETILVLGGSQGARSINQAVLRSLGANSLPESCQLLWQTGAHDYDDICRKLGDTSGTPLVFPFENRMELVYAAADLVIARAGAISLAEIEANALPALLIPYPFAAGDHQRQNARASVSRGIAEMIDPDNLEETDLLAHAVAMIDDGRVDSMRRKLKQYTAGKKPAVDVIAEDIIRLVAGKQEASVDRTATGT
jgi:UDP-N-acetylglucosamine--N-acetylmuramyl-(pentapeptide) pyrophosphoryl-undecaprenol N-acetylglucosamine transferase